MPTIATTITITGQRLPLRRRIELALGFGRPPRLAELTTEQINAIFWPRPASERRAIARRLKCPDCDFTGPGTGRHIDEWVCRDPRNF